MPKKKRTFESETLTPAGLRLVPSKQHTPAADEQAPDHRVPRKSVFSPELIARLAERIKKL